MQATALFAVTERHDDLVFVFRLDRFLDVHVRHPRQGILADRIALASLATGREDEWTALPLATRHVPSLPPEPFKRLGGGVVVVRAAIMACERADEDGRRAPLPARLGAALPRLFRMEIGTR